MNDYSLYARINDFTLLNFNIVSIIILCERWYNINSIIKNSNNLIFNFLFCCKLNLAYTFFII